MEPYLNNPFAYWAIIMGMVVATAVIVSSALFAVSTAFKVFNVFRLRKTYTKVAKILYEVSVRQQTTNPDLSALCLTLFAELDPSSELLQKDLKDVRSRLNLSEFGTGTAGAQENAVPGQ